MYDVRKKKLEPQMKTWERELLQSYRNEQLQLNIRKERSNHGKN